MGATNFLQKFRDEIGMTCDNFTMELRASRKGLISLISITNLIIFISHCSGCRVATLPQYFPQPDPAPRLSPRLRSTQHGEKVQSLDKNAATV
jgi:hypothetical protein